MICVGWREVGIINLRQQLVKRLYVCVFDVRHCVLCSLFSATVEELA